MIIAFHFPPLGGIGTRRSLRYYKNLPLYNWEPLVLTTKKGTFNDRCTYWDQTLMQEISEDNVYRTHIVDITSFINILNKLNLRRIASILHRFIYFTPPDHVVPWMPFALYKSLKIFYRNKIDVIYSTAPPYTSHLIGLILKKLTKKPWVVDLRDPWTQRPDRKPLFKWQAKLDCWMEMKVLSHADLITITTKHYLDLIMDIVPSNKKIRVITNGFNPEDFQGHYENNNKKFRIVYTGVFWGSRNPEIFFDAVKTLIDKKGIDREKIELHFVGFSRDVFFVSLVRNNLLSIFKRFGHVSHRKAIQHMQNADALLLFVSEEEPYQIPGKIFEYCASGKPIIAIVPPDGAAAEVLREISADYIIADPSDSKQIGEGLLQYYKKWESGDLRIHQDKNVILQYTDCFLTKKMSKILNEIC